MTQGEVIGLIKAFGGSSGGGGGGGATLLSIEYNVDTSMLNKTWNEINDAAFSVLRVTDRIGFIVGITDSDEDDQYAAYFALIDNDGIISTAAFVCVDADDYPVMDK